MEKTAQKTAFIQKTIFAATLFFCVGVSSLGLLTAQTPESPPFTVIAEENVYIPPVPDNGSGPMWGFGSSCIGRVGESVYVTELTILPDSKPLNNCGWRLLRRVAGGWGEVAADQKNRTREPSLMAVFPDQQRVYVSTNPTLLTDKTAYNGPARPEIVALSLFAGPQSAGENPATDTSPKTLFPRWANEPKFTEHSYRSFTADGNNNELLILQNVDYDKAHWAFLDAHGEWSAAGELVWPFGADYAKPQPIRLCYPTIALADRELFFCGVSDIVEPNPEWAKFKFELTGRSWDYDFRRLFFTHSADITGGEFSPWVEIASREETCGWITPCDLFVMPDKTAMILWSEKRLNPDLRERFYPDAVQSESLRFAMVKNNEVFYRGVIAESVEGSGGPTPGRGRFHATPDGRLWVIYYDGENKICEMTQAGGVGPAEVVPLEKPLSMFYTATPRAGNAPSWELDLFGPSGDAMRYVQIRFTEAAPFPYEKTIREYEALDAANRPAPGSTLFVGSSTFTIWKTIPEDFHTIRGVNRAFGGSTIPDVIRAIDRIVTPFDPANVVFFCGTNDIARGAEPEKVFADFEEFLRRLWSRCPNCPVFFISCTNAPVRESFWEKQNRYNAMVRQLAEKTDRLVYVDVLPMLAGSEGRPREDLFLPDRLHLTPEGQNAIAPAILNAVTKYLDTTPNP